MMPAITIVVGLVLIALGAFGYLGAQGDHVSVTALIPAFFGLPLLICGLLGLVASLRKHAMHAAVALALVGALAAGYRGITKLGDLFSDAPDVKHRPAVFTLSMAAVCLAYVALGVQSFIAARRRRQAEEKKPA